MDDRPEKAESPSWTSRLSRRLWEGVLPEALGFGFVAIIVGGFLAAWLLSDFARGRFVERAARIAAQQVAEALVAGIGGREAEEAQGWLAGTARRLAVQQLVWRDAEGAVVFTWPEGAKADIRAAGAAGAALPGTADGPSGTLQVDLRPVSAASDLQAYAWGGAAALTLILFLLLYRRLGVRLRPMAAVEHNLTRCSQQIERELSALTLSDSLGAVAQGWNHLLRQLEELQRLREQTAQPNTVGQVLANYQGNAFRRVLDRLPFGVLGLEEAGRIGYANPTAAALLAQPRDGLQGRTVDDVMPEVNLGPALAGVGARGGSEIVIDHTRKIGEQELTLRFRVLAALGRGEGLVSLVTIEDVSQLREEQRARDNFLYHVTHELRTPLTSIHAYVETLTQPGFDDEQTRKECYNVIISETRRLSSLVENILSISQLEVGTARLDLGDIDLMRLVRQMVQDHLGAADAKKIDLTLSLPPKVPKLRGDKQRLSVLLTNLIGNALKYTAEEGKVAVRVQPVTGGVEIAVSDTGIGIAVADQAHVFDKFFRATDESVQKVSGTGLGLAIAREVTRLHGGELRLESELGKGSTFTVFLPVSVDEPAEVSV